LTVEIGVGRDRLTNDALIAPLHAREQFLVGALRVETMGRNEGRDVSGIQNIEHPAHHGFRPVQL